MTQETPNHVRRTSASQPTPRLVSSTKIPSLETPVSRPAYTDFIPTAMKGIVLTSTGESLATPSQAELVNLFNCSPKVGLNFAKIFDFEAGDRNGIPAGKPRDDEEADSPPPSPRDSMPAVDEGLTTDNHNGGGIPRRVFTLCHCQWQWYYYY